MNRLYLGDHLHQWTYGLLTHDSILFSGRINTGRFLLYISTKNLDVILQMDKNLVSEDLQGRRGNS